MVANVGGFFVVEGTMARDDLPAETPTALDFEVLALENEPLLAIDGLDEAGRQVVVSHG
jgi:hypothetical protein